MCALQVRLFVIIATLACFMNSDASTDASPEGANMRDPQNEVGQLELQWNAGVGQQEYEYYVGATRIANGLTGRDDPAANAAGTQLLRNVLEKRSPSGTDADFDVGAADIVATKTIARFLLESDNVSDEQRLEKVPLFANALGKIRGEIVPDYVPKRVVENVAPPQGVPGMAGMDPAAISDPVAREEYKVAIRENRLNNLTNKRQQKLHEAEGELAEPIVKYLSRVAAADPTGTAVVRKAIEDARLTDAEMAQVLR